MGNLGSIKNMFKHIGVQSELVSSVDDIAAAQKILLPGVGAFDEAIKRIDELNIRQVLEQKAMQEKIPVLGICLGMQLLTNSSEEGQLAGLGWIPAKTIRFRVSNLKVPHMGWNLVEPSNRSMLTDGLPPQSRFYFVHSYYVRVDDEKHSILKTNYGLQFDSAIQKDNIFGAQFHPEKSHKFGMQLLRNFAKI